MSYRRFTLPDGTSWPHPDNGDDESDEQDLLMLKEMARAYNALVTHPWGANESAKKIRWLRKAYKEGGE